MSSIDYRYTASLVDTWTALYLADQRRPEDKGLKELAAKYICLSSCQSEESHNQAFSYIYSLGNIDWNLNGFPL